MVGPGGTDRSVGNPRGVKYIKKTGPPRGYSDWCATVAGTEQADWREVRSAEKSQVLESMIADQGGLCAYTMRRIHRHTSVVEHIRPQCRCRGERPGSDLAYENLVACYPRQAPEASCRYGAHRKGGWWVDDGAQFVSPLHPACEHRFRFKIDGEIEAVDDRIEAVTTIDVLGLAHKSLTEDRKRAIDEFIYGPTKSEPISAAKARRAFDRICDRSHDGTFYEFCVALRSALKAYLEGLAKLKQRARHARKNR
ncbi:MAG: TIGR02646 family protein [Gemmatimonadales bacterium]|nr:TIGR02646 family protein [Gemmatimonadales bacterium]